MAEPVKKKDKKHNIEENMQLEMKLQQSDRSLEQLRLSMVLQYFADQLGVLVNIDNSYQDSSEVDKETWERLSGVRVGEEEGPEEATRERRHALLELHQALKNKPLSPNNLEKVNHYLRFFEQVIQDVLDELQEAGTFHSLMAAVPQEKPIKAIHPDIMQGKEEGRRKAKTLPGQIRDFHKEHQQELHKNKEMKLHVHAQLLEMQEKAAMEKDWLCRSTLVKVQQSQELNIQREKEGEAAVERLRERIAEALSIHEVEETFFKKVLRGLVERLEACVETYETDLEAKQKEITVLKNRRAEVTQRLQEFRQELHIQTPASSPSHQEEQKEQLELEDDDEVEDEDEDEDEDELSAMAEKESQD